jgi:hypothetical protein
MRNRSLLCISNARSPSQTTFQQIVHDCFLQDRLDAQSSHPVESTTPAPASRPSVPVNTTPIPVETREPQLPPVTPAFTPAPNHASKPSFTPNPNSKPDFTPAQSQGPSVTPAAKTALQKEPPSKAELRTPAAVGKTDAKANPFAKRTAPSAAKESLMSSLSSAQKQQQAAAAAGVKRKGVLGTLTNNMAKVPKK